MFTSVKFNIITISNTSAVILLCPQPSKELAEQTNKQIALFKKKLPHPGISKLLCVGGTDVKKQISALNAGVSFTFLNRITGYRKTLACSCNEGTIRLSTQMELYV